MKTSKIGPKRNFKSQTTLNQSDTFNSNAKINFQNLGFINPVYFTKAESFIKKEKTEVYFSESVYFLDDKKRLTEKKILNDSKNESKEQRQSQDFYEKKLQKILDLPRKKSSKQASQTSDAKRTISLEKSNPNIYYWYYKHVKCDRDSCKIKVEKKRSKSENRKSILKETQNKIDVKIKELIEQADSEYSVNTDYLDKFKRKAFYISQLELDRYKDQQEAFNSKNFVTLETNLPSTEATPQESTKKEEKNSYFYDLEQRSPTPEISIEPKKKGVKLTIAQLRTLPLSQKFYNDAKEMLFYPDSNSFETKRKNFYLEY